MADKYQPLLNAIVSGDKAAVDDQISKLTIWDALALPGYFSTLPDQTKSQIAYQYQQNPDIIPAAARPTVEHTLQGVTPVAPPEPTPTGASGNPPIPYETVPPGQATTAGPVPPIPQMRPDVPASSQDQTATGGGAQFSVRQGVQLPDQSLVDVIKAAAANAPAGISRVEIIDGTDSRPNLPSSYHTRGEALDILLYDANGNPIYNEPVDGNSSAADRAKTAQAFPIYQQFAELAHSIAQQKGVDLGWGGYFGLTKNADGSMGNAADIMHFDRGGSRGTLGELGKGLNTTGVAYLPGTSVGVAKAPITVASAATGKAPTVAAAPATGTGSVTKVAAEPVNGVPLPRDRPDQPAPDLKPIAQRIASGDVIRKGESGDDVRALQRFLNEQGATDSRGQPLEEDGQFGVATRQAVKGYQSEHPELAQDGVVGPRTMAFMLRDQQVQEQAARAQADTEFAGQQGRGPLPSVAPTDPITEAMQQANAAANAGEAASTANFNFTPHSYTAANIGANLAAYLGTPGDFVRNVNEANANPSFGPPGGGVDATPYYFHPGELPQQVSPGASANPGLAVLGFDPVTSQVFDRLSGGGYSFGAPGSTAASLGNADVIYNTTTAFARAILEGRSPGGGDNSGSEPLPFFPPPTDAGGGSAASLADVGTGSMTTTDANGGVSSTGISNEPGNPSDQGGPTVDSNGNIIPGSGSGGGQSAGSLIPPGDTVGVDSGGNITDQPPQGGGTIPVDPSQLGGDVSGGTTSSPGTLDANTLTGGEGISIGGQDGGVIDVSSPTSTPEDFSSYVGGSDQGPAWDTYDS